jgi:hypothetical protein
MYFKDPTPGANVTLAQRWALGADSLKVVGNTYLGGSTQLDGPISYSAVITPTALSGNVNDYNPTNLSLVSVIRQDGGAADRIITGLAGPSVGRIITFINIGTTNNITLKNQDTGSTAGNRFLSTGDTVLAPNQSVVLRYDSTAARWRPLTTPTSYASADPLTLPLNDGGWSKYFVTGSDATTTLQTAVDVPGMTSGLLSTSTEYEIEVVARVATDATTTGTKYLFHMTGTGTPTINVCGSATSTSATAAANICVVAYDTATPAAMVAASLTGIVQFRGFFTTGTGSPSITFQHTKVTSGTSTVFVGSWMRIRKANP